MPANSIQMTQMSQPIQRQNGGSGLLVVMRSFQMSITHAIDSLISWTMGGNEVEREEDINM